MTDREWRVHEYMKSLSASSHTFAVCAYGESPYLEECVESVLTQSLPTNVIICTSTPNDLIQRIAQDHDLPVFVNPEQKGIGSDWNYAIEQAETSFVTIAHQDDIYCPEYAKKMLSVCSSIPDPLIFFSGYGEIKNGKEITDNRLLRVKRIMASPMKSSRMRTSVFWRRNILRFGSSISCPSVTYNKELIPLPLFRVGMKGGLDWEAWERLSRIDGAFCYDPEILMFHRIHADSETSRIIADNTRTKEDLEILRKFWPSPIAKLINRFYSESLKSNAE